MATKGNDEREGENQQQFKLNFQWSRSTKKFIPLSPPGQLKFIPLSPPFETPSAGGICRGKGLQTPLVSKPQGILHRT